jgi:hypothetical protein
VKNYFVFLIVGALMISVVIIGKKSQAQDTSPQPTDKTGTTMADAVGTKTNNQESSAIFVTKIPRGYLDWKLVSVAHEEGRLNDIRAILGNDTAVKAYREGKLPSPEGSIIARLAWSYTPSVENNKVFARALKRDIQHSFVAGPPTSGVQFMVKDSKKYAATGGWDYAQFNDGKPAGKALMETCFPCHEAIVSRDFIFTRYAPRSREPQPKGIRRRPHKNQLSKIKRKEIQI